MSKKVLLLGDDKYAVWHPMPGIDDEIVSILSDFDVKVEYNYSSLSYDELIQYDLIISYIDGWPRSGSSDLAGALIGYVALGGSLLCLHGGIITDSHSELEQMVGGAFVQHPAMRDLTYVQCGAHPIVSGYKPFTMFEEPYEIAVEKLANINLLLKYDLDGKSFPAAWVRDFGKGHVVYLSQGHNTENFKVEGFRKLIRRSALWCMTGRPE